MSARCRLLAVVAALASASASSCNVITGIDGYRPFGDFYADSMSGTSPSDGAGTTDAYDSMTEDGALDADVDVLDVWDVLDAGGEERTAEAGKDAVVDSTTETGVDAADSLDDASGCLRKPKATTCVYDVDCCTGSCRLMSEWSGCIVDDKMVAACILYKCLWYSCDVLPCPP